MVAAMTYHLTVVSAEKQMFEEYSTENSGDR